jgi:hypothetical protein
VVPHDYPLCGGWDNCVLKLEGERLSPPATRLADVVARVAGASAC